MIIEKEKVPQAIPFDNVSPGEVFCFECAHNTIRYYMKLNETVYTSSGDEYGEEYDAVDLSTGTPIEVHYGEKCIVKHTAKIIFTEN